MFRAVMLAGLVLALSACSTTSVVHQAPRLQPSQVFAYSFSNQGGDNEEAISRLNGVIQSHLRQAGLIHAGDANPKIEVTLKHFYMRSNATRFWAGIMAGRDKILSNVRVVGADGTQIGSFDVDTFNSTAWGTTDGLMTKYAEEIVLRLKPN